MVDLSYHFSSITTTVHITVPVWLIDLTSCFPNLENEAFFFFLNSEDCKAHDLLVIFRLFIALEKRNTWKD